MTLEKFSSLKGVQLHYEPFGFTYSRVPNMGTNSSHTESILTKTQVFPFPTKGHRQSLSNGKLWKDPTGFACTVSHFVGSPYLLLVHYEPEGYNDTYSYNSIYHMRYDPQLNTVGATFGDRYPKFDDLVKARAETDCLNKFADGKAELGQDLLECEQTIRLLTESVIPLAKFLLKIKRGQLPDINVKGVSKGIARRNLEYQYGWRPLASSIYSLQEKLRKQIDSGNFLMTCKRTIHHEDSEVARGPNKTYTRHCDYFTRVQLTGRLEDDFVSRLSRNLDQYGLANPAKLAWELVPWSFVVDWLIPIGNILSTWTATSGISFVSGFAHLRANGSCKVIHDPSPYASDREPLGPPKGESKRFGFVRGTYSTWPTPEIYFKSPFSYQHVANALSLLLLLKR